MRLLGLILLMGGFMVWRWSNLSLLGGILIGIGVVVLIISYLTKRK